MKKAGAPTSPAAVAEQSAERPTLRLPLTVVAGPHSLAARSPTALGAAAFFATLALAIALLPIEPIGAIARGASALVLLAAAATLARRGARRVSCASASASARARGWIIADESGVSRVEQPGSADAARVRVRARSLVRWDEPFGVTVLTAAFHAHAGGRAIVAFTTPRETRYVAVTMGDVEDAAAAATLLARAVVVPMAELSSVLGDGGVALSGADAARLVAIVASHAPGALDRLYLSGARGEPVVLECGALRIGKHAIDLAAPLEWRGFMFHESAGRVAAFYQATWVRQLDAEAVLVAPMPAEASPARDVRELRVVQSLPGEPPARDLRIAIDRLFMLPLRHALDRAPRISHAPSASPLPARPSRPEGRVP